DIQMLVRSSPPMSDAPIRVSGRVESASFAENGIDGVDGPTSTASECQGVAAGAPQKREAVREGVYQNRR
ncbi:MAG: hypothetical protein WCG47_32125, partial [Dermatophilaceae bacterium]